MDLLLILPSLLQGLAMVVDEFYYHRRRGLGRWERIGHPVDTATVMAAYAFLLWAPWSRGTLVSFAGVSALSCLMVTKDEFIHQKACLPGEGWLHSVLFLLHPLVLLAGAVTWYLIQTPGAALWAELHLLDAAQLRLALAGQAGVIVAFFLYQSIYWNGPWTPALPKP